MMNSRRPVAAQFALQPPPQHAKALGQVPVVEGFAEVQRPRLPLQQRQVMHGIVMDVLLVPIPKMLGNDLVLHHEPHPFDPADRP